MKGSYREIERARECLRGGLDVLLQISEEYERMKNCTNCDHTEVCYIVKKRKEGKQNDYSPCEYWKIGGAK